MDTKTRCNKGRIFGVFLTGPAAPGGPAHSYQHPDTLDYTAPVAAGNSANL